MKSLIAPLFAAVALAAVPALADDSAPVLTATPDTGPDAQGDLRIRPPLADTCRDRIQTARAEAGLPLLPERRSAEGDEALLYYAVDRRMDGCNVLVMAGNPDDVRPLPVPQEDAPLLRRLQ